MSRPYKNNTANVVTDLADIWRRLQGITRIHFQATSEIPNGWNNKGTGTVDVRRSGDNELIFREHGQWQTTATQNIAFTNTYRWIQVPSGLRLEHLRRGIANPVFLVDLKAIGNNRWESQTPHICGNDLYSAALQIHDHTIELKWTVRGPDKCGDILNIYT